MSEAESEAVTVKDIIAQLSTLGSILKMLHAASVSDGKLIEAAESMAPGQLIGERLLEMKVITADQLERALVYQRRIREAASMAAVIDIIDEIHGLTATARAALADTGETA